MWILDICSDADFLKIIYFIKKLIKILWFLVPIGLILMVSIDFSKSVIAGNSDDMPKNIKLAGKRILMCIFLFLVPTFVDFTINLINDSISDSAFMSCYKNANLTSISELKNANSNADSYDFSNSSSSNGTPTSTSTNNITSIKLNRSSIKIKVKGTETLKYTVSPTGAKKGTITWSSSNNKVAIVNKNGKVTGLKKGTAIITVKSSLGVSDTCKVTVKATAVKMNIPTINQGASEYYSYRFPVHSGSTMRGNGCGIVATTMIIQYLTGNKNITVQQVATWADNNGHFNGIGSNGTIFNAAAKKWGVGSATEIGASLEATDSATKAKRAKNLKKVVAALQNGQPVVSFQYAGIFTKDKHFIVLSGITEDGKIYVNNPSNGTQRAYKQSEVDAKSRSYFIFNVNKSK